jgi:hypothetical protein
MARLRRVSEQPRDDVGHDAPVDPHVAAPVNRLSKNPATEGRPRGHRVSVAPIAINELDIVVVPSPAERDAEPPCQMITVRRLRTAPPGSRDLAAALNLPCAPFFVVSSV